MLVLSSEQRLPCQRSPSCPHLRQAKRSIRGQLVTRRRRLTITMAGQLPPAAESPRGPGLLTGSTGRLSRCCGRCLCSCDLGIERGRRLGLERAKAAHHVRDLGEDAHQDDPVLADGVLDCLEQRVRIDWFANERASAVRHHLLAHRRCGVCRHHDERVRAAAASQF
jgi:hypothetical protein